MEDMLVDFCPQCSGVWLDGDEYEESAFEPVSTPRERDKSPYRSAAQDTGKPREVTCQDCARPVTVATSYVWEYGFLCRACFGAKQQRAGDRRVVDAPRRIDLTDVLSWVLTPRKYRTFD
jgi:Zn-finger nucleic acid-binding protein